MKKVLIVIVFLLKLFWGFSQPIKRENVPTSVVSAFEKKYPEATAIKWDKEGNRFEASFKLATIASSVLLDKSGNFLESEVSIKLNLLPKGVTEYVMKNYKGAKIKEASKITTVEGMITYEAAIKGKDLIFNSEGEFVRETKD